MSLISLSLPYLILAGTVTASLFLKNKYLLWLLLTLPVIPAMLEGVLMPIGLSILIVFTLLSYFCFNIPMRSIWIKSSLWSALLLLIAGFISHKIPGFTNTLAVSPTQLSPLSCPFSMYLNFDTVTVAFILYITSGVSQLKKKISLRLFKKTFFFFSTSIVCLLFPAWLAGYITWDLKLPSITGIWLLNNFLFVCFSEEMIFKGVLQHKLTSLFPRHIFLSILTISILFGAHHFKAGGPYILFSTLAGIIYGYTYHKTVIPQ